MGKMKWMISDVKTKLNPSNCKQKIKVQKKNIKKGINTMLNTFINKDSTQPLIEIKTRNLKNGVVLPKLKKMITKNITTSQAQPLLSTPRGINKKGQTSLRERMMNKLKAARFRYLNEQLYLANGKEAYQLFNEDPESFEAYHSGFKQQITQWPINPLDIIIRSLKHSLHVKSLNGGVLISLYHTLCDRSMKPGIVIFDIIGNISGYCALAQMSLLLDTDKIVLCNNMVIADFGCGDAKLAASLESATVHSFDLIALNDRVTVCDMSHTPLHSASVDIAVFCLSLMGTNLSDFIKEANRVLKEGGILKIAEVESRFDNVNQFVQIVEKFGFKVRSQDLSHNLFYFLDFQKESNISKRKKKKLPYLALKPCLYKKR